MLEQQATGETQVLTIQTHVTFSNTSVHKGALFLFSQFRGEQVVQDCEFETLLSHFRMFCQISSVNF
jgi:hypothetical protein